MNKLEFMDAVDEILDECKTEKEMLHRFNEMQNILKQQYVLKLGYKRTMGEFEE